MQRRLVVKIFQKTAEALQLRLRSDEELTNTCDSFINYLKENLSSWCNSSEKILTSFEETIVKSAGYLRSLTDEYKEEMGSQATMSNKLMGEHKSELEQLVDKKQKLATLMEDQFLEIKEVIQSLSKQQESMNEIIKTNNKNYPNDRRNING